MTTANISLDLTIRTHQAAEYLTAHGWTQGAEQNDDGFVCATGAVRYCAPQTGDEYVIRAVLRHRGRAEEWNDEDERTADEVVFMLASTEITDDDLAEVFGPNWRGVVTVVRQAASLTPDQASRIAAAWDAAWDAVRGAAWDAVRDAVRGAARDAARDAAWAAAWDAAWDAVRAAVRGAAWDAVRDAAWDAARAEVVRDLITPEQYDTITAPWRTVFPAPQPGGAS